MKLIYLILLWGLLLHGQDNKNGATTPVKTNSEKKDKTAFTEENFGYMRVFARAKRDVLWKKAASNSARMMLVRKYALKTKTVSSPVSDRYMVTCYGGPVDLVHFLCLSANICSGKHVLAPRLYREWVAEGGFDNLQRFNLQEPPEAHPDDLPSNALGALWGYELKKNELNLDFDLQKSFDDFVKPLRPVPDVISKQFSSYEIVMGYPQAKPAKVLSEMWKERKTWFTAEPLLLCHKINKVSLEKLGKKFCSVPASGERALEKAGLVLRYYKRRSIIILRRPAAK